MASARPALGSLDGAGFDVAIIGGGINGTAAAALLAERGYAVLLVEREDFGVGASSRSGRVMHCGLRYLDRGEPLLDYLVNPGWFLRQCGLVRTRMTERAELCRIVPERMRPVTLHLPVYRGIGAAPALVGAALRLVELLGPGTPPLDRRRTPPGAVAATPLLGLCRPEGLRGAFSFREYLFDWPERLCADYALAAAAAGATVRNYTSLGSGSRGGDGRWTLRLADGDGDGASVTARLVLNTAGPWADELLGRLARPNRRLLAATKGAWIALRLPADCAGHALATFDSKGYPFYVLPWRDHHYIGPTETPFEGAPDGVAASEEDIAWLLRETARALPGLAARREDVVAAWAGIRPMPLVEGQRGKQNLVAELHEIPEGSAVLSLTGGAVMVHRSTARSILGAVAARLPPGRPARPGAFDLAGRPATAASEDAAPAIASREMVVRLADLVMRRTDWLWTRAWDEASLGRLAAAVGRELGWDAATASAEAARCALELQRFLGKPASA